MPDSLPALLARLEADRDLRAPERWRERGNALERLDACLTFAETAPHGAIARARALQAELAAIERAFCADLRGAIRRGERPAWLLEQVRECARGSAFAPDQFDARDSIVADLLELEEPAASLAAAERDLVPYQPTPARHIFDFLARAAPQAGEVVVDFGSGLGHVPLLSAICTEATCVGIEREPAYVAVAQRAARALGLRNVRFEAKDVRDADLSDASLCYLYTPFTGAVLRGVLDALRKQARRRALRIATFGPCTAVVARESWLEVEGVCDVRRPVLFRAGHSPRRAAS